MQVSESLSLPKFSKGDYTIAELLLESKKLDLNSKASNMNSDIYYYKGINNKVYGIKAIKTKVSEYQKEFVKTDIACSELYFLKCLSKKSDLFPVLIDYQFHENRLLILSEWIQGITLTEYIKSEPSNNDFQSIIFQVLFSLEMLYLNFGIIHGDLHSDNILLKLIPRDSRYLEYSLSGNKYYTENTGYIPVVWDFGFSRQISSDGNTFMYQNLFKYINYAQEESVEDHLKLLNSLRHLGARFSNYLYYCIRRLFTTEFDIVFEKNKVFKPNSKRIN